MHETQSARISSDVACLPLFARVSQSTSGWCVCIVHLYVHFHPRKGGQWSISTSLRVCTSPPRQITSTGHKDGLFQSFALISPIGNLAAARRRPTNRLLTYG